MGWGIYDRFVGKYQRRTNKFLTYLNAYKLKMLCWMYSKWSHRRLDQDLLKLSEPGPCQNPIIWFSRESDWIRNRMFLLRTERNRDPKQIIVVVRSNDARI